MSQPDRGCRRLQKRLLKPGRGHASYGHTPRYPVKLGPSLPSLTQLVRSSPVSSVPGLAKAASRPCPSDPVTGHAKGSCQGRKVVGSAMRVRGGGIFVESQASDERAILA